MKKALIRVWIVLALIVCAGLGWWIHIRQTVAASAQSSSAAQATLSNRSAPNSPVVTQIILRDPASMPTANLWQAYSRARQKALQQNPELAAEYKELQAEMNVEQHKLESAIVRADPKTAPIIAKYHAMRERRMALMDAAQKSANSPGNLTK